MQLRDFAWKAVGGDTIRFGPSCLPFENLAVFGAIHQIINSKYLKYQNLTLLGQDLRTQGFLYFLWTLSPIIKLPVLRRRKFFFLLRLRPRFRIHCKFPENLKTRLVLAFIIILKQTSPPWSSMSSVSSKGGTGSASITGFRVTTFSTLKHWQNYNLIVLHR